MDNESRSSSPAEDTGHQRNGQEDQNGDERRETGVFNAMVMTGEGPYTLEKAERVFLERGMCSRSPSPPKSLFRSTTGKGVAFTAEDVSFLCKFLAYRKYAASLSLSVSRPI